MIIERLLPSCREVTRKLAEGEFEDQPWYRRVLLRMHLSMCEHCNRFARQLQLIGQSLRDLWSNKPQSEKLEAIKKRILSRLKQP